VPIVELAAISLSRCARQLQSHRTGGDEVNKFGGASAWRRSVLRRALKRRPGIVMIIKMTEHQTLLMAMCVCAGLNGCVAAWCMEARIKFRSLSRLRWNAQKPRGCTHKGREIKENEHREWLWKYGELLSLL